MASIFSSEPCCVDAESAEEPWAAQAMGTLLSNHREAIAAMDFFTVSTLSVGVLYCFFVIAHDRERIRQLSLAKIQSDLSFQRYNSFMLEMLRAIFLALIAVFDLAAS